MTTGITLLDPWLLVGLALLPPAIAIRMTARRPSAEFSSPATPAPVGARSWRHRLRHAPAVLRALAITTAIFALARPVALETTEAHSRGIDIVLNLDLSSSMANTHTGSEPSRFATARAAIARFVDARPHDRIALCGFAAYADLVCPPTLDHASLLQLLDGVQLVEPDSDEDMTGIGNAIAASVDLLRTSDAASRVIVVFTDGEENVAGPSSPDEIDPIAAATMCRHFGIRLHAITAGASAEMQRACEIGGGRAYSVRAPGEVAAAFDAIDELEQSELDDPTTRTVEKSAGWILVALACVAIALLLEGGALGVGP